MDEITAKLLNFIRLRFLGGNSGSDMNETTPLLEWGILSSLNMVVLLDYIREEFDSPVPPERINAANFKDVAAITAMVGELQAAVHT
jgi:acyl carrier protein